MHVKVYLAGEIHSDWRDQLAKGVSDAGLPVTFLAPVTDHPASDDVGVNILGVEDRQFWKDHKGGKINAIRTRTMIDKADIVVVRFGDKYKQWNAAFEAGFAAALGKPLIIMHDEGLISPAEGSRRRGPSCRRDTRPDRGHSALHHHHAITRSPS